MTKKEVYQLERVHVRIQLVRGFWPDADRERRMRLIYLLGVYCMKRLMFYNGHHYRRAVLELALGVLKWTRKDE